MANSRISKKLLALMGAGIAAPIALDNINQAPLDIQPVINDEVEENPLDIQPVDDSELNENKLDVQPVSDQELNQIQRIEKFLKPQRQIASEINTAPKPINPPSEPVQPEIVPNEMDNALKQRDDRQLLAALMEASGQIGAGIGQTDYKPGQISKNVKETVNQPLEDIQTKQKAESDKIKLELEKQNNNPSGPLSQVYREVYKQVFKKEAPQGITPAQMKNAGFDIDNLLNRQMQMELIKANKEMAVAEKKEAHVQKKLEKQEELVAKQQKDLEKRLEDPRKVLDSIEEYEGLARQYLKDPNFTLDQFDKKKFKGDLPGINIPGLGRITEYSDAARDLDASFQRILNDAIRATAGKSVTKNELERIKAEYAQKKFNTEPEMLSAMSRVKKLIRSEMQSRESGYTKEAKDRYKEAGGITSEYGLEDKKPTSNMVRIVTPDGRKMLVPEANLEKAKKLGAKVVE